MQDQCGLRLQSIELETNNTFHFTAKQFESKNTPINSFCEFPPSVRSAVHCILSAVSAGHSLTVSGASYLVMSIMSCRGRFSTKETKRNKALNHAESCWICMFSYPGHPSGFHCTLRNSSNADIRKTPKRSKKTQHDFFKKKNIPFVQDLAAANLQTNFTLETTVLVSRLPTVCRNFMPQASLPSEINTQRLHDCTWNLSGSARYQPRSSTISIDLHYCTF